MPLRIFHDKWNRERFDQHPLKIDPPSQFSHGGGRPQDITDPMDENKCVEGFGDEIGSPSAVGAPNR